jgi:PTS system mannose-specific IIB component/fructoselysine and glucoselysine-specific PTS system IIB component
MSLVLCRVDDRLVHGQVVIGWGRPLGATEVILIDDAVAESPWEQDLYRMATPAGLKVRFATTAAAVAELPAWQGGSERTILLTGDLATMAALRDAHPAIVTRINLGGIHHRSGRDELLRYLYLDEAEVALVRRLAEGGAEILAQDLPTTRAVGPDALL